MDSLSVSLAAIQEEKWSAKFMIKLGGEEFSSFFICLLDPKMKQAYRDFVNHKRNLFEDFNAAYGSTSLYWLSETVIRVTVSYRGASMEGTSMTLLPSNILKEPMTELADMLE